MILITGASGFLGQHLLRFLSNQDKNIRALYHNNSPSASLLKLPNVVWEKCDLLDIFDVEKAFENIEEVYHCAAQVSFETADKYTIQQNNLNSTANVVNAALDAGIRKLVHVSSIATLGRDDTNKLLSENDFWVESKNNSAYSHSKFLAEMEVWRGIAEGLNAVIVNPSIILGEGNWDLGSARLIQTANKEFPFYTEGINGWVDVKDVVRAMVLLMNSDLSNERFIVSEGNYSYREIFTTMANALGKKPPHIKAPKWAISLLWRWNLIKKTITGKAATLTKETTRTAQIKCSYDNSKLLETLPHFSYTPIRQTIERMANAFLKGNN